MANELKKIINWSELSRYIAGGDRSAIRPNRMSKANREKLDSFFSFEIPLLWMALREEQGYPMDIPESDPVEPFPYDDDDDDEDFRDYDDEDEDE